MLRHVFGNLIYLLFCDAARLVNVQTIEIDIELCVTVLVDVVKDTPGNIPLDSDPHLLILLVSYSVLVPLVFIFLTSIVLLLCNLESLISLHIVLSHYVFVLFFHVDHLLVNLINDVLVRCRYWMIISQWWFIGATIHKLGWHWAFQVFIFVVVEVHWVLRTIWVLIFSWWCSHAWWLWRCIGILWIINRLAAWGELSFVLVVFVSLEWLHLDSFMKNCCLPIFISFSRTPIEEAGVSFSLRVWRLLVRHFVWLDVLRRGPIILSNIYPPKFLTVMDILTQEHWRSC